VIKIYGSSLRELIRSEFTARRENRAIKSAKMLNELQSSRSFAHLDVMKLREMIVHRKNNISKCRSKSFFYCEIFLRARVRSDSGIVP